MDTKSRGRKRRNDALPSLNEEIDALNLARDTATVKQAKDVFESASAALTTIRVGVIPIHAGRLLADERRIR
jgi:hypothetical protein